MNKKGYCISISFRDEILDIIDWEERCMLENKKVGLSIDVSCEHALNMIKSKFNHPQDESKEYIWISSEQIYYLKQVVHHFLHGIYPTDEEKLLQIRIVNLEEYLDSCVLLAGVPKD